MNDKIKDLLAQSYKTDSIAKNKWRIENREKLREQRKKELKELIEKDKEMSNNKQTTEPMVISQTSSTHTAQGIYVEHLKKDKTMSNNKQSSVEWLAEIIRFANKDLYAEMFDEIEQAKAMHKEEIRMAYMDGAFEKMRHFDGKEFMMPTEYYNEIYGGGEQ